MKSSIKVWVLVASVALLCGACKKEQVKPNKTPNREKFDFIITELQDQLQGEVEVFGKERELLDEIHKIAQDIDSYYAGVDDAPDWEAKYNLIRQNMRNKVGEVELLAREFYKGNTGKTILAINSYVLMSYHSLERFMPEFMWTKLGLFAANEVRGGIVLSYALRQLLIETNIDLEIKELDKAKTIDILYSSNDILIEGQINVFTDIGALGLLNRKYGPETFLNESWLTQEARDAYTIQVDAQKALNAGDIELYQDLQTEAAILFGAHEQLYTLDPLWQTETMGYLAELNIWMHKMTLGNLALFGDIFIGVNKFRELNQGHIINLPTSNNDLRIGRDRVEIARKGFHTLNKLRKKSPSAEWVKRSEEMLGIQKGMYNIQGFKP